MSSSRDKILNAVKEAVKNPSHLPELPEGINEKIVQSLKSITPQDYAGLRDQFAKELKLVSGEFVLVKSSKELISHLIDDIKSKNYSSLAVSDDKNIKNIALQTGKESSELECIFPSELDTEQRKNKLASANAALVNIDYAVSDVATLVVLLDNTSSLYLHYLPDCIYVIVKPEQMIANLFEFSARMVPED